MEYIKNTTDFSIKQNTVLSIGKFDGLHRGHELLMDYLLQRKKDGLKTVIFTFDIPPKKGLGEVEAKVLTTNSEKEELFERLGIDYIIECPFTKEIMCMEPRKFIEMLVEKLHVRYLVAGTDCRFGHNRSGTALTLKKYATVYNYEVQIVDKMQCDGRDISSTFIREEIQKGNIEKANELLGYRYFTEGHVQHGNEIGRTIGIPTINLLPDEEKLLPPFGVYVTETEIDGRCYRGISNIGVKPTIEGEYPIGVETHLFDFAEDVYEKNVKVSFLSYERPEKKFDSIEKLKEQMQKDIQYGRDFFERMKNK